ncbi:RNA-binding S4 domain-containing protein [Vibrio hepatarius]|uniref:RNA-binding S4 domain-containing protein n=1 Tax=Vibrio hepatarius TaxID=171383 RepID=UPI001C0A5E59|nr:RNA-binding S4 domain-containing protein [Vibrio hepatarius]MBU2899025.1 RNA-binding S4 domain-containing protein [Vibrio hepatarius]
MTEDDKNAQEIEIEAIGVDVSSQPVELYKVFKLANLVGGGGEAKHLIAEGYVAVNGDLETRKRRKMYHGDVFEFNQEFYVVICDDQSSDQESSEGGVSEFSGDHDMQAAKPEKADKGKREKRKKKNDIGRTDIDFF